jgi:hypothetical protein
MAHGSPPHNSNVRGLIGPPWAPPRPLSDYGKCVARACSLLTFVHYRADGGGADSSNNALYSDLTLVAGDREFKVRKIILHLRSPVFCKMLSGGFFEAAEDMKRLVLEDDQRTLHSFAKGSTVPQPVSRWWTFTLGLSDHQDP